MPVCKVHNVGFYKPETKAIYSMALERKDNKLAVARSDASIEIWNLSYLPFIERTISSNLENFSIEGLCWCSKRLFSVGLHGWLIEYDLYSLNIKNKWAVTGEAGTCLDANGTTIAVGTEQGYINIYRLTEEEVEFENFLDKQEGRIICLKYTAKGDFLVAGSINAIRIWNVKTGHAIHKMVLGRSEAKKDTIVWCLEVLNDFTIFSGDSRGVLTIWDGKIGSQIESYQSHKADITAICVDEREESVYAAGVDPLISNYEKVKVGHNIKWVKSIQRKIHDHDVRSMVFHRGRLYSAGVDTYLVCSYYPPKTLIKYAPVFQSPCVQVADKGRRILLRHSKHLEVWQLGSAKKTLENFRGVVELESKPQKLVVIQKLGKNWEEQSEPEGIVCAAISRSGHFIFLATVTGYRLYILSKKLVNNKPQLTKVEDLDDNNLPCVQATFNDVHNELIVALSNGNLTVYELENDNPFIGQRIERNKDYFSDTVTSLTVSKDGKYLIVADASSNIVVFEHTDDCGYSFYLKLPRYDVPQTAIGINPVNNLVVVAYADNKVTEYNLNKKRYTDLSKRLENSSVSWKSKTHPFRSITFDPKDDRIILLHEDSNIVVITKADKSGQTKLHSKVPRIEDEVMVNGYIESPQLKISTKQKFKHLVHLASLSEGELVAVEVNPLSILEKLPPAFAQKAFGSK